eukprot:1201780-Rhodomonas_salina.1
MSPESQGANTDRHIGTNREIQVGTRLPVSGVQNGAVVRVGPGTADWIAWVTGSKQRERERERRKRGERRKRDRQTEGQRGRGTERDTHRHTERERETGRQDRDRDRDRDRQTHTVSVSVVHQAAYARSVPDIA